MYRNDTIFAEKQKKSVFLAHVPIFYLYLCGAFHQNNVKKKKHTVMNKALFRHYLKVAVRSLERYKSQT
ncbi:MAG: hypothetical protein IK011_02230, partial [Bacteroidaceae bacterium]|nr:hypothetical protein [Bacteroidaceae bacterium]